MSTSCGFFNSLNRDRRYNASHFGHCFDGIILDGILSSIGDCFIVKANSGMTVTVGSGKSWYLASWLENDADLPVTLDNSDVVLGRIDAVVMEFDSTETVRWNDVKIVKGTPSSIPVAPTLVNTASKKQVPLAFITVNANTSEITQADITNVVGTSESPFVTGLLKTVNTDELVLQWESQFEQLFSELEEQITQAAQGTIIDGAVSAKYYITLSKDNWKEGTGDYFQNISIAGMLSSDEPIVDIDLSKASSNAVALAISEAWSVYRCTAFNGYAIFRATDVSDIDIPVKIRCVRK